MSGIIRFTSDPHFGHNNMAKRRGFPDSKTWILGDITMEKNNYTILNKLNGYKRVILGNHDKGNGVKHMLDYVNTIHGMVKLRDEQFGNIWLTHCPVYPAELDFRVNYNIHGHIHDGYIIDDERYINICMEVQDYTPKTLQELIKN